MEEAKKTTRTRKGKSPPAGAAVAAVPGPASGVLVLSADLRIGAAATTYSELAATDPKIPLTLDASAVAKIDAAGLQAVVAGLRARAGVANWNWHAPSDTFVRAVRLLGLQQVMVLPT